MGSFVDFSANEAAVSSDPSSTVESTIGSVESAYSSALDSAGPGLFGFGQSTPDAYKTITAQRPLIDAWEARGRAAVASGTAPSGGWSGWIAAGQSLTQNLPGISDAGIVNFGVSDITDTISSEANSVVQTVTSAASKAASAALGVGTTLKWVGIGAVVIVIGLVALKYGPRRS